MSIATDLHWTQSEVERMHELRKTLSVAKTARELGRSVKAVEKKLKRIRLREQGKIKRDDPRLSWSEEQKEELRAMRLTMSARLIAEKTGRNLKSVQSALVRYCGKLSPDECMSRSIGWEGGRRRRKPNFKNPVTDLKTRARSAVYRATRSGTLVRKPCERCGCETSEAHHEDYTRPLDVIWLCRMHHEQADKAMEMALKKALLPPPSEGSIGGG